MNRTMPAHILIVDDEAAMRSNLREVLQSEGYRVSEAAGGREALDGLEEAAPDLVMLDLRMPDLDGMEVLSTLNEQHPDLPVIMLTAHGTSEASIRAMKLGAYDYVEKPFELEELLIITQRALDYSRMLHQNRDLRSRMNQEEELSEELVGGSSRMRDIFKMVGKVADTDTSVLLEGESGTGKEMIANIIHFNSDRALGPFVKVNCAAFSEGVVESELFGHERGSFTGALATKKGRFELADGGTLLIDEVGDLPPSVQVKILRFLQERTFQRVGGHRDLKVDVRIVSATNRKLEELVAEGSFREDLYYRLCVVRLKIPPLRERREDIDIMCEHFLRHYSETHNRDIDGISDEVRELMRKHTWPGNVRELMNCVESMVVTATGRLITLDNLPEHLLSKCAAMQIEPETGGTLAAMERQMIAETLEHTGGDKPEAARILGIGLRTLYRKIERWGL